MNTREIINRFDQYLSIKGLQFEAVAIGGAALNLLGVVTRPTKDCDILYPEIPAEIAEASRLFAVELCKQGSVLQDDWLNNGPVSLSDHLLEGWEDRLQSLFAGKAIHLRSLHRSDLLCASCLPCVIGALTLETASRLRRLRMNSAPCSHGWSNRMPTPAGQPMFVRH